MTQESSQLEPMDFISQESRDAHQDFEFESESEELLLKGKEERFEDGKVSLEHRQPQTLEEMMNSWINI